MSWGSTLPVIEAENLPGWFETIPGGEAPGTGWWAGLDIDGALTVQFITQAELVSFTGWELVVALSVNRNAVLQAVKMLAAERALTVTIDLGLGGTFFLANDADLNVDRLLGLGLVHDLAASQTITSTRQMQTFMLLNYDFAPGVVTVGRSNTLALNAALSFTQNFTANRLATFGFINGINASQQLTVNRNAALGFPPTADLFQNFTTVGAGTYTIPRWANFIAMIALGGGGGGQASAAFGAIGKGGYNGEYGTMTVERGVDIPWSQTTMAVDVGAGGAAGVWDGTGFGKNGEASTVVTGAGTLTGPLGAGGAGFGNNDGESPGNLNYDGISAVGGAVQTGNAAGNAPGGGGAGSPSFSSGYAGARGQVWFRAYQ